MPFFLQHPLFTFICYLTFFHHHLWVEAGLVDLTSVNRREQVPGLPDWSQAGFERGTQDLPDDSKVGYTLTADQLASQFGLIANDGQDDTDALQKAINAMAQQTVGDGMYRLIQLPAGTINLSYMIYVDTSYLIIRGAGANPDAGGTKLVFRPDEDTKYDTIVNERWDLDNMKYSWDFVDDNGNGVSGEATGGWLWPGRSVFRVGSSEVASKYSRQHSEAPRNRKELFKGSVNYHWRSDEHKTKGWAVSQDNDKAGVKGTSSVRVNRTETKWVTLADESATDVWIASPVKRNDFVSWGVETEDWFVNSYVFQDWATVTGRQTVSDTASIWELDRPLRFDVFRSSIADGSTEMEDTEILAKVSPIAHVVHHVGIEHLYITHEIDGLSPSQAERNYGNLAPEQAHHGIVFRYARDSYVRGIRTFMTGSHPIATESARNIQIQDNFFDGAWNKGKGGNGYLRGSRLWDSVIANNTLRNLRHITMQWCAMGNVVILNNITNDMNLHGGYESQNLFKLNYASVSYSHRSGSCSSCGGEAGDQEPGTWYPIWWAAGEKASKWSGASGYQNVFYRNYMIKQQVDGGEFLEYLPYFAKDGSLSQKIWQLGWDNQSPAGSRYAHLATESGLLKDWNGFEKVDFSLEPNYGANSFLEDPHTSLFLKDVSAATGTIVDFSSIKGNDYCRGDVEPNVVGFYMASSASRNCVPFSPSVIDHTKFTHLVFAYGSLAADGTISVGSSEASLLTEMVALKSKDNKLRISLAIGGWGIGASPSNLVSVATNGGARRRLGTTGAAICSSYGLDGIDLEWAPGISANQFNNIVQDASANLGAFNLSISTPHSFWSSSGINLYAKTISASVEFISLLTHDSSETTLSALNGPSKMESTLAALHKLEVPRGQILFGVPFYGRSKTPTSQDCVSDGCAINSGIGSTSECIASTDLGQGTFPYYSIYSMDTEGGLDTSAARVGEGMDITSGRYWTSAGDILQFETPDSVREKARQATMLCAGGLSVFSLDQDNRDYDLTNAIWDGGALLPTAAEIVSTLVGEPLDENGLVSGEFWEDVSAQLLQYYANLPVDTMYKVFILIAIWALDEVAGSLYEYLNFSAMTEDSFSLYKKWETKALNWAVANYTGMGNDFWQCSYSSSTADNFKHETCPGGHNTRGADVDDVYWKLTDSSGFATYMTDNLELDTGTMLIGEIPVGRNPSSCGIFRPREVRRKAVQRLDMDGWQDDGTGRLLPAIRAAPKASALASHRSIHRQRDLHSRHHIESMPPYDPSENSEGFSPYDPDEDCRTMWHDVLVIDGDNYFPNVKEAIQTYLDSYEEFKLTAIDYAQPDSRSVDQLMPILQMALTTLVSGNDTLASTMGYIAQVNYDKALQEEYDRLEEQARQAGIQLIIDIILTLLSFVPFGGLASAAARVARLAVPAFRSARVTRSLGRSLEKVLARAEDPSSLKFVDELLSDTALAGRGRIGRALDKVQEICFQCEGADYVGMTMDFLDLASPIILDDASLTRRYEEFFARRSLEELEPRSDVPSTVNNTWFANPGLVPRYVAGWENGKNDGFDLGTKKHCIFMDGFSADSLKSTDYMDRCHETSDDYPIAWMKEVTDASGAKTWEEQSVKYTDCRPKGGPNKDKGGEVDEDYKKDAPARAQHGLPPDPFQCQCDHLLEANEIVEALRYYAFQPSTEGGDQQTKKTMASKALSEAEAQHLCRQPEYKAFLQGIEDTMNSKENMRPLADNPNQKKSNLLDALRINKSTTKNGETKLDGGITKLKKSFADNSTPDKAYMTILDKHMKATETNRASTATKLDDVIEKLSFEDADAAKILKKMNIGRIPDPDGGPSIGRMENMNIRALNVYDVKVQLTSFRDKPALAASQPTAVDANKKPAVGNKRGADSQDSVCSDSKEQNKKLKLKL